MVGGKGSTVVAFNKMTGQVIWKTGSAKGPGYCAPGIHQIAGMRQLIVWDAETVCGLNPETGDYLWQVALPPTYEMSIGMPRIEDRKLFVMSFNRLSAMIEIAEDGLSAKLVWKSTPKTGIGGVMDTAWLEKGYAYGTGHRGYYTCVDILTGKRQWENKQPTNRSTGERAGGWPNVFTIKHQPTIRDLRNTTIVDMLGKKLSKSTQVKKKSRTSPSPDPSKYKLNTIEKFSPHRS